MTDCAKVKECGREAYSNGLCLPHLKGFKPERPARKRAAAKKPGARSRTATQTTEATGQTTEAVTEVTS